MAELGEKAGYSRGLPTHHFGSKAALLQKVAETVIEEFRAQVTNIQMEQVGLPVITAIIRQYAEGSRTLHAKALLILTTRALIDKSMQRTIAKLNQRGISTFEHQIRLGVEAGQIRPDIDPAHYANMIFSFLRGQLGLVAVERKFENMAACEAFIETLTHQIKAPD
ncbi:MAG: hypothetical protein Hens2KO_10450 [Henriciella sp.]